MIEISNNNNTITRLGIRNTVLNEFVELYTPEKLKNLTVKNFCDKSIKTITKDLKVSFVDFLRSKDIEDDVADATAYVSYTWNTKFLDLVDAINNHFKDKKRVFIWVDIFCLNQHAPITLDLDWWRQLKNTITEIGQIIVVLCPWESPGPLTVSWNLYEIFCAAQSNIRFEATMSKAESKAFITSLHSNFDAIDKMIPKIDVVNGKSLYPYDKESLLDYIRKTEGYDVFDDTVMKKMKGWLIKYIRMGLSEVSDDDDKVRVKITLGKVLRTEELYDESERMFTECLYLPREDRSSKGTVPERKFRLPITHPDRLVAMSSLSFILKKQKNFEKAVALAELCVDESQELFGDSDDRHIQYMGDLADLYAETDLYGQAENLYNECILKIKAKLGEFSPQINSSSSPSVTNTYTSLNNLFASLAHLYSCNGHFEKAAPLYLERYQNNTSAYGKKTAVTCVSLHELSVCYCYLSQFDKAEPLLIECYNLRCDFLGTSHPDAIGCMNDLALLYESTNRPRDAERMHLDCMQLRKQKLGYDHVDTLASMANLASFFRDQKKWTDSESILMQIIDIKQGKYTMADTEILVTIRDLAQVYVDQGRHKEALTLYVDSLEECKQKHGLSHEVTLEAADVLAHYYTTQGYFREANGLFARSFDLRSEHLGEDHENTLNALENLSSFYCHIMDYDSAAFFMDECVELRERKYTRNHMYTIQSISNLGKIYKLKHDYATAELLFEEAYELAAESLGSNHLDTIPYLANLATLYRLMNIPDLGIDVTTRMIQLTTQQLGRDHPQTLMCKNTLANFYYDSKEYDQAEEVYLDIIEDANMLMGTKNLQTLQYIFNLGVLYCAIGSMLNTGLQKIDFCIEEGNRMLMISASSKEFIGSSKNNEEAAVDVALQRELAKWVATRESYNKTDKCIIM